MSITWRAATAGLEAANLVCAAVNLVYFLGRAIAARPATLPRRIAASVLAVVAAGAVLEGAVVLTSLSVSGEESVFPSPAWFAVRVITFGGTACISALVLRTVGDGK